MGPIATSALTGAGRRGTDRADEGHDPLGGQARDGHDHDLQADQGLRPRPQGSGSGRPDHRHAGGTPRPFGGHRCRLAFHRRRDADRRGPPGKLRLRETPADLEGRAARPAPTGTAQQPGVVVRAGGAAESEGAGRAGGETAAGRRLRLSGAEGLARGRARRAPGLGGLAVPGASRLFPRDRPAAHGAVSGLPGADQSEEAAGGGAGDRGWRGLYGERSDGERVCLAGGAAGLYAHLHAHEPMAEQRPLRGGRRPGVRIPAGGRTRRRTGLRALLPSRRSARRCGRCSKGCSRASWPGGT